MFSGLELRSRISSEGRLQVSLEPVSLAPPVDDEVIVKVEAAPLNPTDQYLMTGPADFSTLAAAGTQERPVLTMAVSPPALAFASRRLDVSMPVGAEGAGTVVATGPSAQHLMGKRIACISGGMFTQYRKLRASDCTLLPDDVSSIEGAALFVNPLTVLGFVETMRREGHTAIVHAAAASNLGQMLLKVCLADGIGLVNIVRSEAQVALLRSLGATHVVNSSAPDFEPELTRAVTETGARVAFDPVGGGKLASQILNAMEVASVGNDTSYLHYGSSAPKQVYIYGGLDRGPTVLERRFGFAWSVGGWLLFPFLARAGHDTVTRLKHRVVAEAKTTFASRYTRIISLSEALDPDIFRAYQSKTTGEKYLIDPTR
jgi:NADPH:quinone reductase-like Zn-dependent oxidoreductase